MDRRSFLQRTGAVLAGGMAWSRIGYAGVARADLSNIGVQLYTLRSIIGDDVVGTLEDIYRIGYRNLEFAGYYGHSPLEMKQIIDDIGLHARSGHFGLNDFQEDADAVLEGAATLGMEYAIVPSLPGSMRSDIDAYKSVAQTFNELGEKAREYDIQFGYHNHSFEFEEIDGQIPYDVLLDETDDDLVAMELDLAWIVNAGHDPLAYFNRNPGRFHLWHVKDLTTDGELANVGSGRIDFPTIFDHADQSGLRYGIVEHDRPGRDPVAAIANSFMYLSDILG
ncbi:MAG: sugar phosphate isomerase/epimerase [Rhodothermales bacterium]